MPIKKNIIQTQPASQPNEQTNKPKRGRKSKKELLESLNLNNNLNNSIVNIEFTNNNNTMTNNTMTNNNTTTNNNNILLLVEDGIVDEDKNTQEEETDTLQKPIPKKRGRKPKGGKIITNKIEFEDKKPEKTNIILHLKCSTKDLQSKNDSYMIYPFSSTTSNEEINIIGNLDINNINTSIDYYNNNSNNNNIYEVNSKETDNNININNESDDDSDYNDDNNLIQKNKEIHKKIRILENNLHYNTIPNKRCCCFWDTCEFDNPPIYLVKSIINGVYSVYGCFCSTECACAYLFEEKIDSSVKFERYQLLNNTYGKIYGYTKNIRPAPNPYYMLNKFYGNLNIQDYRLLLSNDRLFLVLDKPVTKIFPELHEDNDEFLLNSKIIPSNNSNNNIKNKLQKKKQTKNAIVNEKFGIGQLVM
jgi:hypothetical protein